MTARPGERPADPSVADRALLRRASAVVAIQTGVAAAVVVAAVIALVYTLSLQERREATEHKLRDKVATELSATGSDTRPGVIIDGRPDGCTDDAASAELAPAELPQGVSDVELCGAPFLAYAVDSDGRRAVAAINIAGQKEETTRLARLSVLVGLVGVIAAAGLGWVVSRRAVRPLGDALASQRRFVADASHELRTPVAILHTRAQLLQRQESTGPGQRHEIDQLVDDARVLADVVNDMLLSAEMQHRRDHHQPVDLARVATEVTRSFAANADDAGVDLVVDADPASSYEVAGVPSALRRAVAALVDNAMDHVTAGCTVSLRLTAADGRVRVSVVDDGEGLDSELASELTRRFRRGSNGSTERHRLGLGLALVDEVVRAHDGVLTVDGRLGEGATVTLTFPARPGSGT
ncbi:signal transduction histidine kinase [Haloactinopolyspora alba]|uniref:histidine kinase n=1 Tax=Haloactinopolyspora alba TaxID=648780 RepID=A0A2P8E949_9ACTN|nr:HAMP domain-containing sensor histidine kinase [Haloactinopolyspora alba]PSL06002.1 signal transduction histidine kinase [Haloactinopolyspora alba]